MSALRHAIASAIFDPGATEGFKGDRTLTEWQTDAVMRVVAPLDAALGKTSGTLRLMQQQIRGKNQVAELDWLAFDSLLQPLVTAGFTITETKKR